MIAKYPIYRLSPLYNIYHKTLGLWAQAYSEILLLGLLSHHLALGWWQPIVQHSSSIRLTPGRIFLEAHKF